MVGFVSDIILNFLSTKEGSRYFKSKIIQSLRPYFDKRTKGYNRRNNFRNNKNQKDLISKITITLSKSNI